MNFRFPLLVVVSSLIFSTASAQGLRKPGAPASPAATDGVTLVPGVRAADFIVAVVNSEPITNQQVMGEVERMRQQLVAQGKSVPDALVLARQVLSRMIDERAQLQLAREQGIKIDEPSIDQAEQQIASQNRMSVEQLRGQIAREGLDITRFREQLRDQLLLTRLREREVEPRVRVSDAEVDQYLKEQQELSSDPSQQVLHLAHLLVSVPEGASEAQLAVLQDRAQRALRRVKAGENFAAVVGEMSDAQDRVNGGDLGLRRADRYPSLYVEATATLKVDETTGLLRSGAGFHIVKLLERRSQGLPPTTVTQSRARHILLVPGRQMSEAQALEKLRDLRRRIQAGQADFATLARQNSQDGSAAQGGDLGWANPGQFVPEFEEAMNRLSPGQISEPLISRFGVHLIELVERRRAALGQKEQREMVRGMLREKKLVEVYESWAQDVRARAYVEFREAPL